EVPLGPLADVAALLVAEERHGPAGKTPEPRHDRGVVRAVAVAVQLDEVLEEPLDVVQGVRAVGMARELDGAPDLVRGRPGLGREPLELPLEALELARDPGAAEERKASQARQPLTEPELGLTWHRRRAGAAG